MSATVLKLIALALMLGDHIAEFIPGAPIWLHWLGRISAPLFIFCMCEGFFHTHDRKKYLLRIYLCGVGMSLLDVALIAIVPKPYNMPVNNIFVTLAIISAIIGLIEGFRARKRGTWKWLIAFLALQLVSIFACAYAYMGTGIIGVLLFTSALLPSIFYCEGGVFVVLLGVMLYYVREKRVTLAVGYVIYCAVYLAATLATGGVTVQNLLYEGYQWMMIGALPFMLAYNGERGAGLKYLFYIFYPLHIAVLYLIGNLCF